MTGAGAGRRHDGPRPAPMPELPPEPMPELTPDPVATEAGLPGWFVALRRAVDAATTALNVLGTLLIVFVMILVNSDILGRTLFNAPVSGVPELVSMSIVAIVFLQIAQTFRRGRLTRTEMIPAAVARRRPRVRQAMELVFAGAAGAVVWQLFAASLPLFEKSWARNTYEGTVGDFTAPIWPVKLIILIGCAALLVQIGLTAFAALLRLTSAGGTR